MTSFPWFRNLYNIFDQFGCRLAAVSLIFLHLGQYWHLATQDKLLWACILVGSFAACNRFMAPICYFIFIISVLLQLPFKSYLVLVIYRIIYSRSSPCITCLHKKFIFLKSYLNFKKSDFLQFFKVMIFSNPEIFCRRQSWVVRNQIHIAKADATQAAEFYRVCRCGVN